MSLAELRSRNSIYGYFTFELVSNFEQLGLFRFNHSTDSNAQLSATLVAQYVLKCFVINFIES